MSTSQVCVWVTSWPMRYRCAQKYSWWSPHNLLMHHTMETPTSSSQCPLHSRIQKQQPWNHLKIRTTIRKLLPFINEIIVFFVGGQHKAIGISSLCEFIGVVFLWIEQCKYWNPLITTPAQLLSGNCLSIGVNKKFHGLGWKYLFTTVQQEKYKRTFGCWCATFLCFLMRHCTCFSIVTHGRASAIWQTSCNSWQTMGKVIINLQWKAPPDHEGQCIYPLKSAKHVFYVQWCHSLQHFASSLWLSALRVMEPGQYFGAIKLSQFISLGAWSIRRESTPFGKV